MTDRAIRGIEALTGVDFAKGDGLVPVVVQDADSGAVLMLAYADEPALRATLESGRMHFWSRSRETQWMKGETSGHTLDVESLHGDCDGDAVLALVRPNGPTCHTGDQSCFGDARSRQSSPDRETDGHVLDRLDATLAARASERPTGSYTVRLLDDENLRLKKLGEETAELVAALATGDAERATAEAADLLYHALVGLRALGVGAGALLAELEERAG